MNIQNEEAVQRIMGTYTRKKQMESDGVDSKFISGYCKGVRDVLDALCIDYVEFINGYRK